MQCQWERNENHTPHHLAALQFVLLVQQAGSTMFVHRCSMLLARDRQRRRALDPDARPVCRTDLLDRGTSRNRISMIVYIFM